MNSLYHVLLNKANHTPILSTHEHHLPDEDHRALDLDQLWKRSYVNWCSVPEGYSENQRASWLDKIRYNSYFVWLKKAICSIYEDQRDIVGIAVKHIQVFKGKMCLI